MSDFLHPCRCGGTQDLEIAESRDLRQLAADRLLKQRDALAGMLSTLLCAFARELGAAYTTAPSQAILREARALCVEAGKPVPK